MSRCFLVDSKQTKHEVKRIFLAFAMVGAAAFFMAQSHMMFSSIFGESSIWYKILMPITSLFFISMFSVMHRVFSSEIVFVDENVINISNKYYLRLGNSSAVNAHEVKVVFYKFNEFFDGGINYKEVVTKEIGNSYIVPCKKTSQSDYILIEIPVNNLEEMRGYYVYIQYIGGIFGMKIFCTKKLVAPQ
jgi:hypothetical protein